MSLGALLAILQPGRSNVLVLSTLQQSAQPHTRVFSSWAFSCRVCGEANLLDLGYLQATVPLGLCAVLFCSTVCCSAAGKLLHLDSFL